METLHVFWIVAIWIEYAGIGIELPVEKDYPLIGIFRVPDITYKYGT